MRDAYRSTGEAACLEPDLVNNVHNVHKRVSSSIGYFVRRFKAAGSYLELQFWPNLNATLTGASIEDSNLRDQSEGRRLIIIDILIGDQTNKRIANNRSLRTGTF